MPANKRHHFVPHFYLKRFSQDGKSINIFNISKQKLILGGKLKTQCIRDYLYGKEPEFEHHLADLEGIASTIISRITDTAFFPNRHSQEWIDLLLFILVQSSRTVASISDLDQMTDRLLKRVLSHESKFSDFDPSRFTIRMTESSKLAVSYMAMALPLAADLSLKILRSSTPNAFICSDNPIVFYNQLFEDNSSHSYCGIASKGLQVFVPISPRVILCFYDKKTYHVGSPDDRQVLVLRSSDVDQLNGLQYVSADENIYFCGSFLESLPIRLASFRRKERTKTEIFGEHGDEREGGEFIATSRQDIRTALSLSFIRLTKHAREFYRHFTSLTSRPVVVPRDSVILESHERFMEEMREEHRKLREKRHQDSGAPYSCIR